MGRVPPDPPPQELLDRWPELYEQECQMLMEMHRHQAAQFRAYWWLVPLFAVLVLMASGCTENQRAKQFGGTATVDLPKGQKLVTATWRQDDMWILTRPLADDEQPVDSKFQEKSSFGVIEGTVIFHESK